MITEKAIERRECPKCHGQVSSHPSAFARHINKCTGVPAVAEAEVKEEAAFKSNVNLDNIKDDSVRKIMEQALKTQEAMRQSPQAFVSSGLEDEHMVLRRTYAPQTLERYDAKGRPIHTHTAYIGRADQLNVDVGRGYVPVLNEQGQIVRNRGGDILYMIDRKISEARIRAAGEASRVRVDRVTESTIARNPDLKDGDLQQEVLGAVGTITMTEDDRNTTGE
jgi:hypothetical protein